MIENRAAFTGTSGWKFAVLATLSMAIIALGIAVQNNSREAANIAALREVRMFQAVEKPTLEAIRQQLLSTPLDPLLLHGFIAHRVSSRDASVLSNPERRALESLGWQSTIVQTALIQDAIARADETAVLKRVDGLLRRGKLTQQLIDALVQIEQTGSDARYKLVTMLSNEPRWRRDFLLAASGIEGNKAALARFATLEAMFARGVTPNRDEVAPIVNSLLALGHFERAKILWLKLQKNPADASVPSDPHFVTLATYSGDRQRQTIAFEWRPGEGLGYSAQASSVGDDGAVLQLRWDGRGAPVLLQQKLIVQRGWFAVIVKSSLIDRAKVQRIGFVFYCSGFTPVFYDQVSGGVDNEFIFTGREPVRCDNPELQLVGNSENATTPIELELNSILVKRQRVATSLIPS